MPEQASGDEVRVLTSALASVAKKIGGMGAGGDGGALAVEAADAEVTALAVVSCEDSSVFLVRAILNRKVPLAAASRAVKVESFALSPGEADAVAGALEGGVAGAGAVDDQEGLGDYEHDEDDDGV